MSRQSHFSSPTATWGTPPRSPQGSRAHASFTRKGAESSQQSHLNQMWSKGSKKRACLDLGHRDDGDSRQGTKSVLKEVLLQARFTSPRCQEDQVQELKKKLWCGGDRLMQMKTQHVGTWKEGRKQQNGTKSTGAGAGEGRGQHSGEGLWWVTGPGSHPDVLTGQQEPVCLQ